MEITELNQDVLGLILEFLGNRVTLISPEIRDKYFREKGIWIYLIDVARKDIDYFPSKFWNYPLNLDLKYTRCSWNTDESLDHIGKICAYLGISDYIFQNTVSLGRSSFVNLKYFPNLKKVRNSWCDCSEKNIEFLEKTKIIGCVINILNKKDFELLDKIRDLDYKISICYSVISIPPLDQKIRDKIAYCSIWHIDIQNLYNNLKMLNFGGGTVSRRISSE